MMTHSFVSQDFVAVRNSSLKANPNFCYPLSSTYPESLHHDSLEQSVPPTSFSHSLAVGSICDMEQGSHITQVEEQKGEDAFNISSLFQNLACQTNAYPLLYDSQTTNIDRESNAIYSFN